MKRPLCVLAGPTWPAATWQAAIGQAAIGRAASWRTALLLGFAERDDEPVGAPAHHGVEHREDAGVRHIDVF